MLTTDTLDLTIGSVLVTLRRARMEVVAPEFVYRGRRWVTVAHLDYDNPPVEVFDVEKLENMGVKREESR